MNETDFSIRMATPADIPTIVHQRHSMFHDMGTYDADKLNAQDEPFATWVGYKMMRGEYLGFLMENSAGEVIAGGGLWLIEWIPGPVSIITQRGYVMNVYTEREYRGKGLAKRVVRAIMNWCYHQGIEVVSLHASDQGRPIYESLGFTAEKQMSIILTGPIEE